MLISIVMMIRNEEKNLKRTLDALLPLMNDINSELIILDTGSTDNSVDIAKKYTERVYFDVWNDNFADMRNKSISYASGEWILILDADEELIKYDKLAEFFNSKLDKKYNSASIELKSLSTEDGKSYSVGLSPRLFKNEECFRYEGAIHEQPIYKKPMYNNIASFNHYGYMYEDEEIKNKKLKRNGQILESEYNLNPDNPYICYQLGQNYASLGEKQDALCYFEKSHNLYKTKNQVYIPTQVGLIKIYLSLGKYEECEKICDEYIKQDDKNIDIYYYYMLSKYNLRKYNESLNAYKKYVYLIENFSVSTQANDITCMEETICYNEYAQIKALESRYNLKLYENVIDEYKKLNETQLKKVYKLIFESLYKLNSKEEILNIYVEKSKTLGVRKEIIENIESFIAGLKVCDKYQIYMLFSEINDNYGTLNKVRLGEKISCEKYNQILQDENECFYADLIYYALEIKMDIESILKRISKHKVEKYLTYTIRNRRDCILQLYNYLINENNTLDIEKLGLYSTIAKTLFLEGNLKNEKCEKLFYIYITYQYEYLKQLYNQNLNDEDILQFTSNKDDLFIINIINIQNIKNVDKFKYIKSLKHILIQNTKYREGIQILVNKFENELKENEELLLLKKQYKNIIETNIKSQNLDIAINMIKEYESMFDGDYEILNMKSIIQIIMQNFESAEKTLKNAFLLNNNDYNIIFNIAYLKEVTNQIDEAINFYNRIINSCKEESIVLEAKEKINSLIRIKVN